MYDTIKGSKLGTDIQGGPKK